MTHPEIPKELTDAGYRIELGGPGFDDLEGKYWWTQCTGGDVMCSEGEWDTPEPAIEDARRHQREYHGPCAHCEGEGEIDVGVFINGAAMQRRCPICAGTGDQPAEAAHE